MSVNTSGRPNSQRGFSSEIHFARKPIDIQVRQGIHYAEQRNLFSRLSPDEAELRISGILSAFDGTTEGFQTRLAVSLGRANPWLIWEAVQNAAGGPLGHNLIGVDFCSFEEGFPPAEKRELFNAVRDFKERHPERALAILYHVGESFEDKLLESAVRWVHEAADMSAHHFGHAIKREVLEYALYV